MRKVPAAIAAGALALGAVAAPARAGDEAQDLFVILGSGSTQTQAMAMVLANHTRKRGPDVDILLCDAGARLAVRGTEGETVQPPDRTPGELMRAAMRKGADVSVCAIFLPSTKHTRADLIDGVTTAKPPQMVDRLVDEDTNVMSF